jgi:hypothetical protein
MKQTAVEWLFEQLKGVYESDYLNKLVEQAKEMEKQQNGYSEEDIKFAYEQGARLALISQSPMALHKGEFPTPNEWFEQIKNK